ncbi:BQ2448_3762 [Microbotryum intermedium]|uniref:BQ2448_3762 protein n=1 Tax=Microbotryum intermedium TaxID=269621 RepID=A0A238FAX5_9BASI|nr:BQ2448_3762 [Microbotryum intermedium]
MSVRPSSRGGGSGDGAGYLPEAPILSTGLSNEIEEEFQHRQEEASRAIRSLDEDYQHRQAQAFTALDGRHHDARVRQGEALGTTASTPGGSIMFPSSNGVYITRHGRSGSSASAPVAPTLNKRASMASTHHPQPYGAGGDDAETTSVAMAGSRPPSTTSFRNKASRPQNLHRRTESNTGQSALDSDYGVEHDDAAYGGLAASASKRARTTGYFFHDQSMPGSASGVKRGKSLSVPQTVNRHREERPTPTQSIPGTVHGRNGYTDQVRVENGDDNVESEREDTLDREEAWYMLRALVGLELDKEESQLWRLKHLDAREDLFRGGDESTEEDFEDEIDPRNVPILRYLIRHFLLTLPLVRDTVSKDLVSPDDQTAYWTEGIYPLIRAFHNADLSKLEDRGIASLGSQLYGKHLRNAIERFVSAGLKLSSSSLRPPSVVDAEAHDGPGPSGNYHFIPAPQEGNGLESPNFSRGADSRRDSRRFSLSNLFGVGGGKKSDPPPTPAAKQPPMGLGVVSNPNSRRDPIAATYLTLEGMNEGSGLQFSGDEGEGDAQVAAMFPSPPMNPALATPAPASIATLAPPVPSTTAVPHAEDTTNDDDDEQEPLRDARSHKSGKSGHSAGTEKGPPMKRSSSHATCTTGGFTSGWDDSASFVSAQETSGTRTMDESGRDPDQQDLRIVPDVPVFPTSVQMRKQMSKGARTIEASESNERISAWLESDEMTMTARLDEAFATSPKKTNTAKTPTQELEDPLAGQPYIIDDGDTTIRLLAPTSPEKTPSGIFGFASRLRTKSSNKNHGGRVDDDTGIAAMTIPAELLNSRPVQSAPLQPKLLSKGGAPWPFGAPVPFWRGAPYERLKWGGFEADVVGVRNGLFSHAFIIRVRRPQRLDEYVVRSEAQFLKYFKVLDRQFPAAHIRRIPISDPKDDTVVTVTPALLSAPSSASIVMSRRAGSTPTIANASPEGRSHSRLAAGLREAAADPSSPSHSSVSNRHSVNSNFARTLRAQSLSGDLKGVRRNTVSGETRPSFTSRALSMLSNRSNNSLAARMSLPVEMKKMPPHDARRRALRAWLRDTLSIRTIGHHKETAAFLLLGAIVPKDRDVVDITQREMIDEARRSARVGVAGGAAERARVVRAHWDAVERECINGDGFVAISDALRNVSEIEKLPARYFKTIESLRFTLAQGLYDLFVGGEASGPIFTKLKALHAAFPYFLVKQAFKIGRSKTMAKYLQDILLARPFGSKSLLQKILAITLDDDPAALLEQIARYRQRIGSATMTEKLDIFAHETREKKEVVRQYAEENGIELVLAIVRGADEPRLPAYELERVVRASKRYRAFMKTKPSALARAQVTDTDIRLVLDLQYYFRLVSRDRDSNIIREMLGEDAIASALEVLAGPFVELIKRIYKVGNLSQAVGSFQRFLDQLIIIIEALRSRIQEPQKSVRILARLLGRHQQAFYEFIRSIHRRETIIEELLQWFWTASVFLRRGLAEPVNLDDVLSEDHEEKMFFLYEVEDLVTYHRKKRAKQYQATCRRYAGDVDADDPVIVEGDGKGKSKLEPFAEPAPRPVTLLELPIYLDDFTAQLKRVFAV